MKRHWIEYTRERRASPMSFWVHIPADGKAWRGAQEFLPPFPKPVPGYGYPYYRVEIDGFTFEFASPAELRVLIETFSRKLLPSNLRLSMARGAKYGPGNHWLNRLPKKTTSWSYRQKAVRYLQRALKNFEAEGVVD
jgi:hypothetical protein